MNYVPDPRFRALYSLFTPDEGSIGERLNGLRARLSADDPLLVATGTDVIVFPGGGRPALTESSRIGTRGFIMRWLRAQHFDWNRMMVIISGRAGRTTAGLTWQTNNMCHLLWRASQQKLAAERVYIAPHAPSLQLEALRSDTDRAALEAQYRQIWFGARVTVEVGREMFEGYPAFQPTVNAAPTLDEQTRSLGEMPALRSLKDRRALITRLRFVMEDPGQQLSNAVAHYIIDQMSGEPIDPAAVFVPGFTDVTYPCRKV